MLDEDAALAVAPGGRVRGRTVVWRPAPCRTGVVAIVTAGTADLPVAEEAAVVAEVFGHRVDRLADVGVAGIHRVLARRAELADATVIIVAAGTSYHAGLVGRYAIEWWSRVPVEMDISSEFRYRNPIVEEGTRAARALARLEPSLVLGRSATFHGGR